MSGTLLQKPLFHEILASVPGRKLENPPFPSCFPSQGTPDKPGDNGYFGCFLFSYWDRSGPITRWKLIERLPLCCARPSSRLINDAKWIGDFEAAAVASATSLLPSRDPSSLDCHAGGYNPGIPLGVVPPAANKAAT